MSSEVLPTFTASSSLLGSPGLGMVVRLPGRNPARGGDGGSRPVDRRDGGARRWAVWVTVPRGFFPSRSGRTTHIGGSRAAPRVGARCRPSSPGRPTIRGTVDADQVPLLHLLEVPPTSGPRRRLVMRWVVPSGFFNVTCRVFEIDALHPSRVPDHGFPRRSFRSGESGDRCRRPVGAEGGGGGLVGNAAIPGAPQRKEESNLPSSCASFPGLLILGVFRHEIGAKPAASL